MNVAECFSAYNKAWESGRIEKPLVLLIGGHIGTGKSTFAKTIEKRLLNVVSMPTGIIRSIQQANTTFEKCPVIFLHSYELGMLKSDLGKDEKQNSLNNFIDQANMVQNSVLNIIRFSETEGQQYIIEGNHILPEFTSKIDKHNIISFFLYVPDFHTYINMISGPTHKRQLTQEQIQITRYIHDYIVEQAEIYNQALFSFNHSDKAMKFIAKNLKRLLP